MKKRELLALPPITLTRKMKNDCNNDILTEQVARYPTYTARSTAMYKYSRYYRAAVHGSILKIAIWERLSVMHGVNHPDVEVFISKDDEQWMTHVPDSDIWGTARLDNILPENLYRQNYSCPNDHFKVNAWDSKEERAAVSQYFGNDDNRDIRQIVLDWQMKISHELTHRRQRKQAEEIDSEMAQVRELPKDFTTWAENDAFYRLQYIIYDRKSNTARCTGCDKAIPITKIKGRHNDFMSCPYCKCEATLKSRGKQQAIHNEITAAVLLERKDGTGFFYRIFYVTRRMLRENDYAKEFKVTEAYRISLNSQFYSGNIYQWREWFQGQGERWSPNKEIHCGYYILTCPDEVVLYPRNITRILKRSGLKYMPVKEMLDSIKGTAVSRRLFCRLNDKPYLEYVWKCGLKTLTWNLLEGYDNLMVDRNAKNPAQLLRISKPMLKLAVSMNAHKSQIRAMQRALLAGKTFETKEEVMFYGKYLNEGRELETILRNTTPGKFMRYAEKELAKDGNIGHGLSDYADYLKDLIFLHMNVKDNLMPKNFDAVHIALALRRKEEQDKTEQKRIYRLNRKLKKMLPSLQEIFRGEDDELMIVWPTCKSDFNKEGAMQHNCVGGSYFESMVEGRSVVVFCRRKSEPDKSYTTVEFSGATGKVLQNRAWGNKEAPEDAEEFINMISRKAQKAIKKKRQEEESKLLAKDTEEYERELARRRVRAAV